MLRDWFGNHDFHVRDFKALEDELSVGPGGDRLVSLLKACNCRSVIVEPANYIDLDHSASYGAVYQLYQDFRFGPGTAIVYIRAAPNTTSFRAEPCTSPPPVGARARPSVHRR